MAQFPLLYKNKPVNSETGVTSQLWWAKVLNYSNKFTTIFAMDEEPVSLT